MRRVRAILEMDEPEDCLMCDGSYPSNDGMRRVCVLLPEIEFVDEYIDERAPFCPLIEVAQS